MSGSGKANCYDNLVYFYDKEEDMSSARRPFNNGGLCMNLAPCQMQVPQLEEDMYFSLVGRKELFTAGRVGSLLPQAGMHRKQAVNLKKDKHRRLIQREKDNIDFFPAK